MAHIQLEQALYLYRIIDNSKGEMLREGHARPEDLADLFPEEIYRFLKKEIDRNRLVHTTLKMLDFTYEIKKRSTEAVPESGPSRKKCIH